MRSLLVAGEPDLAERIHLLRRPIREFGSLRPRDRWKSDDPAVVTFAARITPEKGLAVLIEALGALRGDGPIELCIAGLVEHGAYWAHCQRLQAIAIVTNPHLTVTYLGHLDYAATDDLFRRSDIVAIPSQWPEPLGAVAMEAMSAGAQSSPRTSVGSTPISLTAATDYSWTLRPPSPPGPKRWSYSFSTRREHATSALKLIATPAASRQPTTCRRLMRWSCDPGASLRPEPSRTPHRRPIAVAPGDLLAEDGKDLDRADPW